MVVLHPPRPDQHRGIVRTRPAYRPRRSGEEALPVAAGRADRELIEEAGCPYLIRRSHLQEEPPEQRDLGATDAQALVYGSPPERPDSPSFFLATAAIGGAV